MILSMDSFGLDTIGSMSLFGRVKTPDVMVFAVNPDLGNEVFAARDGNPFQSREGSLLGATISRILTVCGFPEIYKSVVTTNHISMVDLVFRPDLIDVKPCQTVRQMLDAVYSDIDVSGTTSAACEEVLPPSGTANPPLKKSGYGIVSEKFYKFVMGQGGRRGGFSHVAVL